jgi:adenosine deaminase
MNAAQPIAALPKAELHLHLEGTVRPATAVELAARHRISVPLEEARRRYEYSDFYGFLEAFKWVASFLRAPDDYALIAERLVEELLEQNVVYAEVIFAAGVMRIRGQSVEKNLRALRGVAEQARKRGLLLRWAPDVARQFGVEEARKAAEEVVHLRDRDIASFGMGGDELFLPPEAFRPVFDYVAEHGLRCTVHAGEVGGPQEIWKSIEMLHAERVGHGIASIHDPRLCALLRERGIPLEVCPVSNTRTGALAKQLGRDRASVEDHVLPRLLNAGIPVTLASDDPGLFHTSLLEEYAAASRMGLSDSQLVELAEASFRHAFLPEAEKAAYLSQFRKKRSELGLV